MYSYIISVVVGGILLLSIVSFTKMVMDNEKEMILGQTTQENMSTIVDFISNDINKLGYQASGTPISRLDSTDLIFSADVYSDDTFGATTIRWYWDKTNPVTTTSNPNDFYLERTGPISNSTEATTNIPVTYFHVEYFDANGDVTSNPKLVRSLEVEIMVEAPEPHTYDNSGNPIFFRNGWKRTFYPGNINLPY